MAVPGRRFSPCSNRRLAPIPGTAGDMDRNPRKEAVKLWRPGIAGLEMNL